MELGDLVGLDEAARRARMFELMNSLSIPLIMSDTRTLLAFADEDHAADQGAVGAVGYCMSGQYAINAATHFARVAAAASIYGVRLVTEAADSPHLAGSRTDAELYFACAEIDHWAPLEMLPPLRAALAATPVVAEVEFYPGVEHGFAFPARAAYDRDAAERHWERLFALFRRRLG
jgi:carboxymethylenebutenolidase